MIPKPINTIEFADLNALVDAQTREGRMIDYKEFRIGTKDSEKKEFLFDLCALGNAGGGDLVIGVAEERDSNGNTTGLPKEIVGIDLTGTTLDVEGNRLVLCHSLILG
ncbi:MAG TPA: RNA-binding domain-containing protein [Pirellulales bacterium]|jgi:predicted HTH transcriptional regulator|nr:RNA-binding domain-containing protein [Pirellulales bacterium]